MNICIIGGGPAGMTAAATAKDCKITLFEKNEKLGKKLYITGKGRCNITNNSPVYEFVENIVNGSKFLYSSLSAYPPPSVMEFLDQNGLRTKTERGSRVFPVTDKSSDVIKAFAYALEKNNVDIRLDSEVKSIYKTGDKFSVKLAGEDKEYQFDRVIIATGGITYKSTGSTGDGYCFADKFGHSIIKPVPGLCGIELYGNVKPLEGLSLKNVKASVVCGSMTESRFGEMLFTANGVSGPIVLTLSSYINRFALDGAKLIIDFKPALAPETLDERLLSDIGETPNKNMYNILTGLLPKSVIPFVLEQSGVNAELKGNSLTKDKRFALEYSIKNLHFKISKLSDINEAIITSGGIKTTEINPTTMESKLVHGLYFAGELLDIDALTGGYNLQIAMSTGYAAGKHAAEE